jgi:GxxExxY protein
MRKSGLIVVTEKRISISYDGIVLPSGLRLDLLVEESVVVEVKAVEKMKELYQSQLLSYLKLTEIRIGLLINFNVQHVRHGIKRMVL